MVVRIKRIGEVTRNTTETKIYVKINLDGDGKYDVKTGVGFLDHMLELFAKHGSFDLICKAEGDTYIDFHHTVEDVGISLGVAIKEALGDKIGIKRYGTFHLPMMEALTRVSLDLSGRGFLSFNCEFTKDKVGEFDTELVEEFFYSLAYNGGINVHMDLIRGTNTHHIIESFFKGFAKALQEAVNIINDKIQSTKGVIQ
ncbi:imidazoleglycerol-phosphate dehydratase HisB [Haliovirga abyssi]|uniref:Imidazoleglycerol-phosphate dehydratase n=1 Tax=Haliovirga abyssi TaxID=2996794 RepID=A0AAU9DEC0_9FUSO|nr:imidazoleglycerol-phosphate dehydratase [Haliovirga abyssi]